MYRKIFSMFSLVLVLAVTFSAVSPVSAQLSLKSKGGEITESPNGIYIIQMIDNPVVAYEGDTKGLKATAPKKGQKIDPNSPAVIDYVSYLTSKHDNALAKVGGQKIYDYVYSFNGFAAKMSLGQAKKLSGIDGVITINADELHTMDTSTTPDFLGLTADGGLWDMGVTGEDVIIGIVDSGIWPEAASFSDRTGTNPNGVNEKLGYHQIPGWHGKCTPGEEFNASMCNQKLIGAQYFNAGYGGNAGIDANRPWEFNSPRDYNGHGTHTASTSGGNAGVPAEVGGVPLGNISGMAPRARIAAYKALWSNEDGSQSSGFTVDLVAAIDQAVADGVDVINYSISGSTTSFDNSVSISFLFATRAGVFVSASAGNNGPGASTVAHNSPWQTTVAAGTHDRYYAGTVTLGDGSVYFGASIDSRGAGPADLVYSANVGLAGADPTEVRLCYPGTLDPAQVAGKIVLCDRGVIARVDKSLAVMLAGGIGSILANTGPSSINADLHYVPTVHVDHVAGAAIRTYATTAASPTATLTGGEFQQAEAPAVASFSSRGPALAGAGDLLKPDIMAPGVDVLAAVAPPGNNGRSFDFYSGTSMSAPHIAGIAALMKDAHPDWSPMMIKSALMTTASTMTNMDNPIPGNYFGYGAGQVVPNSADDPGLVYNSGWNDWLAFLCGQGTALLSANTCNTLAGRGYALDASDLNYPSIAIGALAGLQTVKRTVTNVGPAATYHVSVTPPAGIDVTVDPAELTLAKGESASYFVTFTATSSAVLNQYTFGSLTWSHGPHNVTSPIALYPVAIAVPAEVHGSGTSGSLSFDVTFGYTGDYTAAPHGLVAADMHTGNVIDDPADDIDAALATCDWSSFPYDCVGITWFQITIPADTAYARFSLFDAYTDGNDDLDLYVWRLSNGAFVGGSGSGTSAEQVDVVFPAADVYEVAVHGWGTDGPDANFTLFSWAVPASPGSSNMTLTAPASATLGATESITVDWSGLDSGTKYLGAVSHSDAGGIIDLTLVSVYTD